MTQNIAPFSCGMCEYTTDRQLNYGRHMKSTKHKKKAGEVKQKEYACKECKYKTTRRYSYERHLNSHKGVVIHK